MSATMPSATSGAGPSTANLHDDGDEESILGAPQVAHTLTACTRCRQRKTRCDPALPRCGPCQKTNSVCEYYDAAKGRNMSRSYVVWLQHRVRALEEELEKVDNEDAGEDPEAMMRPADVRLSETQDSKYLGPSSGIAITRLVMQLAKQFTDAKSIKEIVPEQRARQIKELYNQEQAKPTSKVYPLISHVAAEELPNKELIDLLVQVYRLKVQPLYPALHEPTLERDVETVWHDRDAATPYQHFVCRMVIAISLQKLDTQYAGLADSYYLAALKHMEPVVKPMDLKTLQCFALMAEYSLLTPTRTAIYYVVGIAVRLAQSLGYHEEKTVTRPGADGKIDYLEIDMRRRVFWCIFVMDCGLAHSLGRPAILATSQDHLDVGFFETCEDHYITAAGVDPAAPRPTLKKWICIHFFKMRLLQLEMRRKLYLKKRPAPTDDQDPWFKQMDAKLVAWRDASPSQDGGIGFDKKWFIGRYNTMIVMLYRPSPQVPRPSLDAAIKCFDACEYNIYMHREQIQNKNVDLTWVFTQSLFMAINTMLWSLSYVEVRRKYPKTAVVKHLDVAMASIQLASERWPGVASAVQLYENLIAAILQIYEKDGDVPISATTPSDVASPPDAYPGGLTRSSTTSPATVSTSSVTTPPEPQPPFGYLRQGPRRSVEQPPPVPYQSNLQQMPQQTTSTPPSRQTPPAYTSPPDYSALNSYNNTSQRTSQQTMTFDPSSFANPLPDWTSDLTNANWPTSSQQTYPYSSAIPPAMHAQGAQQPHIFNGFGNQSLDPGYPFPRVDSDFQDAYNPQYWDMDYGSFSNGLNQDQQQELMHSLETNGMEDIQCMITATVAAMTPKHGQNPNV